MSFWRRWSTYESAPSKLSDGGGALLDDADLAKLTARFPGLQHVTTLLPLEIGDVCSLADSGLHLHDVVSLRFVRAEYADNDGKLQAVIDSSRARDIDCLRSCVERIEFASIDSATPTTIRYAVNGFDFRSAGGRFEWRAFVPKLSSSSSSARNKQRQRTSYVVDLSNSTVYQWQFDDNRSTSTAVDDELQLTANGARFDSFDAALAICAHFNCSAVSLRDVTLVHGVVVVFDESKTICDADSGTCSAPGPAIVSVAAAAVAPSVVVVNVSISRSLDLTNDGMMQKQKQSIDMLRH